MIIPFYQCVSSKNNGYIAGTGDGIVKVAGVPSVRKIYLFNEQTNEWLQTTKSTVNGNYIFLGLDPNLEYLVMAKDFKPDTGEPFHPFVWNFVKPDTDKTIQEQFELWESWQT